MMKRLSVILLFTVATGIIFLGFPSAGLSQNKAETSNNSGTQDKPGQTFSTISEWESYITQKTTGGGKVLPEEYARAAKTSYKEGNLILSAIWYDEAKNGNYSDPDMYAQLAAIYKFLGDPTNEVNSINFYLENFPGGNEAAALKERLFEMYYSAKNFELAANTWSSLEDSSKNKESLLDGWFKALKENNVKVACDSVAVKLVKVNPKHVPALVWLSEKYYWLGENRYQAAVKKYEQNKNAVAHHIMTQDFVKSTADFKRALSYLDVLWEMDPSAKYAQYLANIYARFENNEKAAYYKSYIK